MNIILVIKFSLKICMGIQKLSEYLPSMKVDGYSIELHQELVDK